MEKINDDLVETRGESVQNILLTGATGFIGKNLVEYFVSDNKYKIYAPSHLELDLLNRDQTWSYIRNQKIDIVIHCANINGIKRSYADYEGLGMSLQMFGSLASASGEYKKMIYFGSGAEYDRHCGKHLITEGDLGRKIPTDPYGYAKYIQAKLIDDYKNIYDLCLYGVYGKYEEWKRRFISNNMVRSLKGLPMTMSQNAMFDYLYVDDLCRIVEWFIEHEPKYHRYNVCTSQPIALLDLAYLINEVSGLNRELQIAHSGWQTEYSGNNERLLNEIGEFQFTDKKKSIKEMWDYYSAHIAEFDEQKLLV